LAFWSLKINSFGFISFITIHTKRPKFAPNVVKVLTQLFGHKRMIFEAPNYEPFTNFYRAIMYNTKNFAQDQYRSFLLVTV
jgi:hypothetical protein